jgi:hypothetical protein
MRILKWTVSGLFLVAALFWTGISYTSEVGVSLSKLSAPIIGIVAAALLANALLAVVRFQMLARDIGHTLGLQRAMAAVSAGSLAGAMFFQLAGQLMARGVVMARANVPFASVVVVTAYERFVAAMVSGLFALGGAYFLFGKIYLDQEAGGGQLVKILLALMAASLAGAFLGYGRMAARALAPLLTRRFLWQCVRLVTATVFVQAAMMAAYIAIVHALAPGIRFSDLIATSAIVMFAASVPISFAGWGVREMSAVFALGMIGMRPQDALLAAVIIGLGSMLAMAVIGLVSMPTILGAGPAQDSQASRHRIDYSVALAWIIPLMVAVLVFFQIYLPIGGGTLLNVNLADPLAILGGVLFVIGCVQERRLPQWRVPYVNHALALATAVLTLSLLIGAYHFGWTRWAVVNRYCGWFILLGYAGTGALLARQGGMEAFRLLLLTFTGAACALAALDIALLVLFDLGLHHTLPLARPIEGFSLNHNFFSFQLLMALAVSFVAVRRERMRLICFIVLFAGIWFAGSRSGYIAAAVLLAAGLYLRTISAREIVWSGLCAAVLPLLLAGLKMLDVGGTTYGNPPLVVIWQNTQERLFSIYGGLALFAQHPIFGAGLGAFRSQLIIREQGMQPLLIHSTSVWLLAELGLVGLIAFLAPALLILRTEFRRRHQDFIARLTVLSLTVFGVMSLPADMLYQRTFWFTFGGCVACAAVAATGKHRDLLHADETAAEPKATPPLAA